MVRQIMVAHPAARAGAPTGWWADVGLLYIAAARKLEE